MSRTRDEAGLPASLARRRASQALALGVAALGLPDLAARAAAVAAPAGASLQERLARTFTAFCDTIVPADEWTPAASALQIPGAILDSTAADELAGRLLAAGCVWLDAACQGDFAAADETSQIAACQRMQGLPWDSPAGRFFQLLRDTLMAEYYARPESWRGLALDRPPQPLGFFDAVDP